MLIAAEDFIVIERDERFDIIYSPYSNKILAMEKSGTEIFRQLTYLKSIEFGEGCL
ncbi:MAG: hypothetical protein ACI4DR_09985 [Roseburia sp.]